MNKTLLLWAVLSAFVLPVRAADGADESIYSREFILKLMHRMNDYQKAHPRMKPDDRNWERATWYTGVMQAWKATGDKRFYDQAVQWGRLHQWQVGTEKCGANRLFCVNTWLELHAVENDKSMVEPVVKWLNTKAPNSPAGAKRWYLENDYSYADALYGSAALVMLTRITGDRKYMEILDAFWKDLTAELLDKEEGLFYRDKRFIARRSPNGKKVIWSRGNGWVIGGVARILENLPADSPRRGFYADLLRTMAASLARRQQDDGLWRPNLADPDHVPVKESSGSGFFCYAIAWGVNNGVLDRDACLPVVRKAWAGLVQCVSREGRVNFGQPVGDQPRAVQLEQTHEYVTGTFLLAAAELYRAARPPRPD